MNQPMPMIQGNMLIRFLVRGGNYKYRWLPECILYPKSACISRFRPQYSAGFRSHYLELPNMSSCSKNFNDDIDFHVTARVTETAYYRYPCLLFYVFG